jgi:hypothetical protein
MSSTTRPFGPAPPDSPSLHPTRGHASTHQHPTHLSLVHELYANVHCAADKSLFAPIASNTPRRASIDRERAPSSSLARYTDGSGTRAHCPDIRFHYDAAFFPRCLPEHADTATPSTATIVADATEPVLQRSVCGYRIQGHVGADSTICLLQYSAAATGKQVVIGTEPAGPPTGPACEPCAIRPPHTPVLIVRLDRVDFGLLQSLACCAVVCRQR